MRQFVRESSAVNVSLTVAEQEKRLANELAEVKRQLAHSHHVIAELRLALAESQDRCNEIGKELLEHTSQDLPIGGAFAAAATEGMLETALKANATRNSLNRFASSSSFFSQQSQSDILLCRWPDLRSNIKLPTSSSAISSVSAKAKAKYLPIVQLLMQLNEGSELFQRIKLFFGGMFLVIVALRLLLMILFALI